MADTYNQISNVAFILAVIFFIFSVVLFFKFNILKIVGDLSGKNAEKAIKDMKKKADAVRKSISSGNLSVREIREESESLATVLLDREDIEATVLLGREDTEATVLLGREDTEATVLLNREDAGATVLLDKIDDNKIKLSVDNEKTEVLQFKQETKRNGFIVEKEISFIHTVESLQFRREYGSV